jgi:ankyrin repeat protein
MSKILEICKYGEIDLLARLIIENNNIINYHNSFGENCLHVASLYGHFIMVRFLLDLGLPVDSTTTLGVTPLINAAAENHYNVVKLLLDRGANPNKSTHFGYTAIYHAAKKGYWDITELLVRNLAKMTTITIQSDNALYYINQQKYNKYCAIRFKIGLNKIERIFAMQIIKDFLLKRIVLHPNSVYIRRLVNSFEFDN